MSAARPQAATQQHALAITAINEMFDLPLTARVVTRFRDTASGP